MAEPFLRRALSEEERPTQVQPENFLKEASEDEFISEVLLRLLHNIEVTAGASCQVRGQAIGVREVCLDEVPGSGGH